MDIPPKLAEGFQNWLKNQQKNGTCKSSSPIAEVGEKELNRLRLEAMNETRGKLTGYDCEKCLNRGVIYKLDNTGEIVAAPCKCLRYRRSLDRLRESGLENAIKRCTFDTWETPEEWQVMAKRLAEKYAADRNGWFVAYGPPGSGKTHICTAICAKLLSARIDVRYMLWRDVVTKAKGVIMNGEAYAEIVQPLKEAKALYIDDFFKTGTDFWRNDAGPSAPSAADIGIAFEIINNRSADWSKLTIISTERTMEDLMAIDEATGSRIYDRSKGYLLDFSGRANWRLR